MGQENKGNVKLAVLKATKAQFDTLKKLIIWMDVEELMEAMEDGDE